MLTNIARITSAFSKPEALPAPVDPLAGIIAARDAAIATLNKLSVFDEQLNKCVFSREDAQAALRAFEAAETTALRQWAETAEGEPPTRDQTRHGELVAALDARQRELEAADAARVAIEPAHARARAALDVVQIRLDHHRAQDFAAMALEEVAELADLIVVMHRKYCAIIGTREGLFRIADEHRSRGQLERAAAWTAAAAKLADVSPVTIRPDPQEVANRTSEAIIRIKEP